MDRLEFEAELRREGFSVVNASLTPNLRVANHCHDFDARLLVLGGEITITRDNNPETFRAGQYCEVPANCMHAEHVGPGGSPSFPDAAATAVHSTRGIRK
jgi:quercetin dioxygenase-like cupin family protein